MLRPRTIILKNPIEMHYVRNGPERQLWLFQFHECYFFIKKGGGVAKKKQTQQRRWRPPLSASQIIKKWYGTGLATGAASICPLGSIGLLKNDCVFFGVIEDRHLEI